jgi:hypothetical protein
LQRVRKVFRESEKSVVAVRYVHHRYPTGASLVRFNSRTFVDAEGLLQFARKFLLYRLPEQWKYRETIVDVLTYRGEFEMSQQQRDFYANNFRNLLRINLPNIIMDSGRRRLFLLLLQKTAESVASDPLLEKFTVRFRKMIQK